MQQSQKDKIKGIMADILNVEISSINDNSSTDTLSSWDSANHISLALAIEEEFGISLDIPDIEKMISLKEIIYMVEEKTEV